MRGNSQSFKKIFFTYLRVGAFSFNASASDALLTHIVERKQWITHAELTEAMSHAALIPGPYHVNLVIATGYAICGWKGLLAATLGFILPGFLLAFCVSYFLSLHSIRSHLSQNAGLSSGILLSVCGLIASATVRLGMRSLPKQWFWVFVLVLIPISWFFRWPFALIIFVGAGSGLLLGIGLFWKRKLR